MPRCAEKVRQKTVESGSTAATTTPQQPTLTLSPSRPASPSYPATGGASGLPISRRTLRKASDPISAGSHSEIAR